MLTSFGEKSAESLIWLGGLAFLSQVSIRLMITNASVILFYMADISVAERRSRMNLPGYRAQGSRANSRNNMLVNNPPSRIFRRTSNLLC
jgi:hypothetical protein